MYLKTIISFIMVFIGLGAIDGLGELVLSLDPWLVSADRFFRWSFEGLSLVVDLHQGQEEVLHRQPCDSSKHWFTKKVRQEIVC